MRSLERTLLACSHGPCGIARDIVCWKPAAPGSHALIFENPRLPKDDDEARLLRRPDVEVRG